MPQFQKNKQKPNLGRAYVWSVDDVGNVFLFLWADPKGREQFFCEFGWLSAQYPTRDRADYRFPFLDPKSAFSQPEMIAGIQRLWGDNGTAAWKIPDPVDSFEPLNYAGDPEAGGKEFVRRVNEQAAMTKEDAKRLVRPVVEQLFERLESDVIALPV